jgi:hypothetical protein
MKVRDTSELWRYGIVETKMFNGKWLRTNTPITIKPNQSIKELCNKYAQENHYQSDEIRLFVPNF